MQLVEQHRIDRADSRWAAIDAAAFASKNLYNAALYLTRQHFIATDRLIAYEELARTMKHTDEFRALPAKVAQWVLKQVSFAWRSFVAVRAAWQADPSKFRGRPGLPKYLEKTGRNLLVYTTQALSRPAYLTGLIRPSGVPIEVRSQHGATLQQVRLVPKKTHYVVEVIYEQAVEAQPLNPEWVAGIDIGLDNLAALASNKPGCVPVVVNGRPLKAINQFYNKRMAAAQRHIAPLFTSRTLDELADKRYRRIQHYLHNASRRLIDYLVQEEIGTLVIGQNKDWKQGLNLGARTNQNFVTIPHARFVQMLCYKAALVGIQVILTEESYTSKCSFLDLEPLCHHDHYLGRRIHRGLFRAASGQTLHADINAALNIIRKVIPDAFGKGIEGIVVCPARLAL